LISLFEKREKENRKLAEKQLERWTSRKEGEGKQKRKSKPNLNWVAKEPTSTNEINQRREKFNVSLL